MTFAGIRSVLAKPFLALYDIEGRRAWAVLIQAGAGVAMTVFASFSLYLVRSDPQRAFFLGVGALLMLAIIITGFAALLVKRDIDLNALGLRLRISDQQVDAIANKVVAATPPPPPPPAQAPPTVVVQTGTPS